MATLSQASTQYRDGVLGELSLEDDANSVLNTALARVIQSLQPAGLQTRALPPAAMASAATAVALAQLAREESETNRKIVLAMATSYAATFFGLPRNDLAYVIDQVCGMFAMTAAQRRDYHQQAARVLDTFVESLKKGNAMSGVFRDGVLGGAYKDGSLGLGILVSQQGATRDGSLGAMMYQNVAFRDGSLGALRKRGNRGMRFRRLSGLGGGCGCSGVGDDAVATETPFYKKPLYIGGAALALGVVLYAVSKR